jgi:hemerythrin superfamily protein
MGITTLSGHAARRPAPAIADDIAVNAIDLLKSDHRQVEQLFQQFRNTEDVVRREALVVRICRAIEMHAQLEQEIFYPAFEEATGNEVLYHQALLEHDDAAQVIGRIRSSPGAAADHYYDARVQVLADLIQCHVAEEEMEGGMFDLAARSGIDLDALGERLQQRKLEIMDDQRELQSR